MESSDLIIIAVKPHVVSQILQEVSSKVTREKLFLSIAAGVTLETLEKVSCLPADICSHNLLVVTIY